MDRDLRKFIQFFGGFLLIISMILLYGDIQAFLSSEMTTKTLESFLESYFLSPTSFAISIILIAVSKI